MSGPAITRACRAGFNSRPGTRPSLSNEVESGTLQTREVCRLLGGKGKVLVLTGAPTDQTGIRRTKDIHDVIATPECSGMEVVAAIRPAKGEDVDQKV